MKSLLFQGSILTLPALCGPCRTEVSVTIRKADKVYTLKLRDGVTPEDPLIVGVRAAAYAIKTGTQYAAPPPSRSLRDLLIKSNVEV